MVESSTTLSKVGRGVGLSPRGNARQVQVKPKNEKWKMRPPYAPHAHREEKGGGAVRTDGCDTEP